MQITFAKKTIGLDQGIPSNLKSDIGQSIGVGKNSILWVKKSNII